MAPTPQTVIRFPIAAYIAITSHPEFRYLDCAARLRGDYVERASDRQMFFELHDPHPIDSEEFMAFAQRVAGHLLEPAI